MVETAVDGVLVESLAVVKTERGKRRDPSGGWSGGWMVEWVRQELVM